MRGCCEGSGGDTAPNGPASRRRTERDATSWSKSKLREVLVGLAVEGEAGRCEISELKQVEGEASCSSRKGKLIFFYEWNLRLSWRGMGGEGAALRGPAWRGERCRAPLRRLSVGLPQARAPRGMRSLSLRRGRLLRACEAFPGPHGRKETNFQFVLVFAKLIYSG